MPPRSLRSLPPRGRRPPWERPGVGGSTVYAEFKRVAARRGDAPFLHVEPVTAAAYGIEPGPRTWREVAGEVERLRAAYASAGYGPGHRVGLLLENRPAFFTHWLALNALGISIVPIHEDMRSAEWGYVISHSEMVLAVVQPGREGGLREAASSAGALLDTIRPEVAGRIPDARSPARGARQTIGRGTECALLYTSGTTGKPKGCRLANGYFLRAGEWYLGLGELATVRPDVERFITPLPLSHMNALAFSSMAAILSGGVIVQLDRFHPRTWWQSVRESGATVAHYLGVMPAMLLAAPPGEADRMHELRFGFGAGVDPRHHAAFEARFGFPLLEAWAMTETGAAACIMANREPRHVGTRCFGRADFFVETRIVDDEGQRHRGRRARRAAGARRRRRSARRLLPRLPQGRDGDRGRLGRRLVPHRRRGAARRRGRLPFRRPAQERHPAQRREHLGGRGGERARHRIRRWPRAPSPRRPTRRAATRCSPASSCARRPTCRRRRRSRRASSATPSRASRTSRRRAMSPSSMPCR